MKRMEKALVERRGFLRRLAAIFGGCLAGGVVSERPTHRKESVAGDVRLQVVSPMTGWGRVKTYDSRCQECDGQCCRKLPGGRPYDRGGRNGMPVKDCELLHEGRCLLGVFKGHEAMPTSCKDLEVDGATCRSCIRHGGHC